MLQALPRIFTEAFRDSVRDNTPRLGASLAFYTLLSLAPVIVIAVAVAAVIYGHEAAQGRLAAEIQVVAGPDVARTVQDMVAGAYRPRTGALATLLGVATLIFGTTSVFVELHDAMNVIWHVPAPEDRGGLAAVLRVIRHRFYSFAVVLGIGFLLLASLVLRIAAPRPVVFLMLYVVIAVLFAALYKIVPDIDVKWSDAAPGAAITALLFVFGKELLGLYFAHASFGSTYSTVGSPVVVLLWVYYSAQLFFWGAEFCKVYAKSFTTEAQRRGEEKARTELQR